MYPKLGESAVILLIERSKNSKFGIVPNPDGNSLIELLLDKVGVTSKSISANTSIDL